MTLHDGWAAVQRDTRVDTHDERHNKTTQTYYMQQERRTASAAAVSQLAGRGATTSTHRMDNRAVSGCEHHLPTRTAPHTTKSNFEQINASTCSMDIDTCGHKLPHAAAVLVKRLVSPAASEQHCCSGRAVFWQHSQQPRLHARNTHASQQQGVAASHRQHFTRIPMLNSRRVRPMRRCSGPESAQLSLLPVWPPGACRASHATNSYALPHTVLRSCSWQCSRY
jgi:hypothetical protein